MISPRRKDFTPKLSSTPAASQKKNPNPTTSQTLKYITPAT